MAKPYFNALPAFQAGALAETLSNDGYGYAELLVYGIVCQRIGVKPRPARGNTPATIVGTAFLSQETIAKMTLLSPRTVRRAVKNLMSGMTMGSAEKPSTTTTNSTGKPYMTKESIPGSRCNRYTPNKALLDTMGNPFKREQPASNAPAPSTEPNPADDTDFLDDDDANAPAAPREFLPIVEGDAANSLARQYWDLLGNSDEWISAGKSWESEFRKELAVGKYTAAQLSGASIWSFTVDSHWPKIMLGAKKGQMTTPYLLQNKDTIMSRYLQSLAPSSSARPTTYTPTASQAAKRNYAVGK